MPACTSLGIKSITLQGIEKMTMTKYLLKLVI